MIRVTDSVEQVTQSDVDRGLCPQWRVGQFAYLRFGQYFYEDELNVAEDRAQGVGGFGDYSNN